jgi:hypothetical protein
MVPCSMTFVLYMCSFKNIIKGCGIGLSRAEQRVITYTPAVFYYVLVDVIPSSSYGMLLLLLCKVFCGGLNVCVTARRAA